MTKGSEAPKRRKKACPKCGSMDVVPILYGYPGPEMMEMANKGKIELGGCCVSNDDPQTLCKVCGTEFDRPKPRASRPADTSRKRKQRPAG